MDPRMRGDDGLALNSPCQSLFADFFTRSKADFAVEVRPEREMVLVRTRSAATMRPAASRMVLRDNGQARRAANNRRLEPKIPGGAWPR